MKAQFGSRERKTAKTPRRTHPGMYGRTFTIFGEFPMQFRVRENY